MSEKSELPTRKRIDQARAEGDSPHSAFASQALSFLVALAVLPAAVSASALEISRLLRASLASAAHASLDAHLAVFGAARAVMRLSLPLLAAVAATSTLASLVQTGGVFSPQKLAFDAARLDVLKGLGRLVSIERLVAVLRAALLAGACGLLGYSAIRATLPSLAHLPARPEAAPFLALASALSMAQRAAMLGLGVAVLDVVWTRRAWLSRLRMSKDEVKREHRESEGDPELKAARERAHQELLASAIVGSVRQASVVVVNPTHLACALRYDTQDGDEAPHLVASGRGELASRIIDAARQYSIPILRDVPLARALIELEVGTEIPEALYEAVAEVLRAAWEER
jgi:flagellar biosynthesis protein FlhB